MRRRRKIFLISLSASMVAIIIGILLLEQPSLTAPETSSPLVLLPETPTEEVPSQETSNEDIPTEAGPNVEIPEDIFVAPEVPFGTIAVFLACLSALVIAQRRSKKKVPQP